MLALLQLGCIDSSSEDFHGLSSKQNGSSQALFVVEEIPACTLSECFCRFFVWLSHVISFTFQ